MPYTLPPQVAGEIGDKTVIDTTQVPEVTEWVEYVLDSPENDDIISSVSTYLISEELCARLNSDFAEIEFQTRDADVSWGYIYKEMYGEEQHKRFLQLLPNRDPKGDFWMNKGGELVVSDRAWEALRKVASLNQCEFKRS